MASVAAGFGLRRAFGRDIADISARLERGSELAATTSGPIEYAREGRGPAVLVSHGAGGGYDQALFVGRELLGGACDIIAPSRFGYLRTPLPPANAPHAQADAHVALLDRLGVDRAIVVGISAGAPSAIDMALCYPDRVAALVLLVPRAYAPGRTVEAADTPQNRAVMRMIMGGADLAFWLALKTAPRTVLRFLGVPRQAYRSADRTERDRLHRIMHEILPLSQRVEGIRYDGETRIARWPLERIVTPTFVMSAQDDLFGTLDAARFTAEHIPGAELMVVETGGHLLVGCAAQVRARLADFLDRHMAPPLHDAA
jgi:pimeloyl-ACP methyl ester carboxylesterase